MPLTPCNGTGQRMPGYAVAGHPVYAPLIAAVQASSGVRYRTGRNCRYNSQACDRSGAKCRLLIGSAIADHAKSPKPYVCILPKMPQARPRLQDRDSWLARQEAADQVVKTAPPPAPPACASHPKIHGKDAPVLRYQSLARIKLKRRALRQNRRQYRKGVCKYRQSGSDRLRFQLRQKAGRARDRLPKPYQQG